MKKFSARKGQAVNVLFTMILFLVFVLCALFTVLIGGKVYENINRRTEENFSGCTALHYVANKVRQGDRMGLIDVTEVDGTPVLEIRQETEDETYITWIYSQDGWIRELFTFEDSGLGLSDGLPITECSGLDVEKDGSLVTITTEGEAGSRIMLSVRSGGDRQ
ncbi:DUF4860 domain-containing protein [Clostridium sp. AM58-1XD]|uniref:DUF4860 domain-containing protein n=1 Tax=Clostridium sp. AM58-1XD TaxID=2292307 RepID=UPI000E544500|nr:DUF4860 domain-containing protein [Clostridium sp. AM58-1XD]RGY98407.1 DUF4860 domain-containing protein [Clostridium sp. AM58-1XD]